MHLSFFPSLAGQTFTAHAGRKKECLVTLDRFLWTSLECWWHQSNCRIFNTCNYLPCWSHDQYIWNENKNGFELHVLGHGSFATRSMVINTVGLHNDNTFHSGLQAQEIRLGSPDRFPHERCGLGTRLRCHHQSNRPHFIQCGTSVWLCCSPSCLHHPQETPFIFTTHIMFHIYHIPLHFSKTFIITFLPVSGRMTFLQWLTGCNPLLLGDQLLLLTVMVLWQGLDSPCKILEGGSVACELYCTLNCLWVGINCACMPNSMALLTSCAIWNLCQHKSIISVV